jgi:hypothetical protein
MNFLFEMVTIHWRLEVTMMKSSPISLNTPSEKVREDPIKRLSLAVRELDKLINRANQLAHLSEQPLPSDVPIQPDQTNPPTKT